MESESSGPFRMFGKKKPQEDEPKKDLDITAALPPTDDFRTSLLMTGLSARFSMLREQDDPKSKLGKASDDSVLFPKRQSRLGDFGMGSGLHDIAEIESVKARQFGRVDSYVSSDDAASTTGSVMNRAKPTEGNNLFGGRQKIYKIPVGSGSKAGGMGGRALYDDDVAQSAFQKWRQAEKERQSLEQDRPVDLAESDLQIDYNRRRETSSTTSSAPSATRDSTAATSVTSSQPASVKDWQASSAAATTQGPALERSVTRTRRLYEQGLSQDLHEQQSSALSRMDTLSRQRPFGSRTPDLTPPVPSPTGAGFGDRVLERRPIISKASAPNLRSFSPPTGAAAYMMSPPESHSKFPRQELKPSFTGNPPLSPPISEAEDYPTLPIQPGDRGKATAMGVFNRPAHQYDDSKYAQRQRQLQKGRDTPTGPQSELTSLNEVVRSPSSSSHRTLDRTAASAKAAGSASHKDTPNATFFDESDDASLDNRSSLPSTTPQLTIERPADHDHPAFRQSALPTPLSFTSSRLSGDTDSLAGKSGELSPDPKLDMAQDSPTLGPNAGLSGMVRHHLRHDSGASSISGITDQDRAALAADVADGPGGPAPTMLSGKLSSPQDVAQLPAEAMSKDQDEFARHLADGARRVRERLTTFVESDSERSTPNTPLPEASKESGALRPNGLGILRTKSSRSSLADREAPEPGRAKSARSQAVGPTSTGTPAPPTNSGEQTLKNTRYAGEGHDGSKESPPVGREDNAQAGLKAFRQARRELQKMKELETQQRHQVTQRVPEWTPPQHAMPHAMPHDNGPPPAMFNRRPRDESRNSSRSRAGSRAASEARDRSGSEASTGTSTYSRGGRHRNGSLTYDEHVGQYGPGPFGRSGPSTAASGYSGKDIRQSPPPSTGINFAAGMSPNHSSGVVDASGKRMGRMRDMSDASKPGSPIMQRPSTQHEAQPFYRTRNGSLLSAAASTPNLHAAAAAAAAAAPPLPPINPRRKNGHGGFARPPEPGMAHGGAYTPFGGMDDGYGPGAASEDEGMSAQYYNGIRRVTSDSDGRGRQGPGPGMGRGPRPHGGMPRGGLPGGMI
ncbi:hypothetical protein CDD83_9188 [Cordyceps sp. RAO-2017]|nr:hypothetical protein CDD83_9188 [Cordyceps sp. RAO-2017]